VIGVLAAWGAYAAVQQRPAIVVAAVVAALSSIVLARSLWKVPAAVLQWDASGWRLEAGRAGEAAALVGTIVVCVDFGAWLLLRFIPAAHQGPARSTWLPVGRHSLGPKWHEFRCAVYSPRPPARGGAALEP
jgi:hypothetical protein